ncbi:hypothetical protein ScPMuIL_016683 [Solemya velum]
MAQCCITTRGRTVCLLGKAKNVDANGTSFVLETGDGSNVQIRMQEPLGEYVSGLTEVHGHVDNQNNVVCQSYIVCPAEHADTFDMQMYNDAVKLMAQASQFYITGVQG